ncbi:MAG: pitrilysin family protein [Thermoanaerobaculia bacterium]
MLIERHTRPNGLRVVLNEDHSAPLVAVNLWYHVGSKNERVGLTGFAHLFEHMLFSGSEHVGNNEHFRHVQAVGGTLNGTTFFDRTNYYETVPSNCLELALWLESDRMGFFVPALTQEKLDVQINVVQEERRMRVDNAPYGDFFERLLERAYEPSYPYHWEVIGSMADIAEAKLDDVRDFFRTWYVPNNAVLTIAGDFDPEDALALIAKYFDPIPAGAAPPRFDAVRSPLLGERRAVIEADVQLPRVYRFYHAAPYGHDEWIAADLATSILGLGKASRLERALVYEQQIAQDVASFVLPTEASGMIMMWATAKEGVDPAALERALDSELYKLASDGPTDHELTRVRNQAETDLAHQIESHESRADLLSTFETFFGDARLVDGWIDRYHAVERDDVRDVAESCFHPDERVTIHYVPRSDR